MISPPHARLKSDVIGLVGAASLGMVFLSPAMTLYGLFGPIFLACGKLAPLAFVLALCATLPTAFSYAVLSRDHPSSGSVADWATQATGPRVGAWAGWLVFLYYFANFIIQVVAVGLFFNELLIALGVALPAGVGFIIGVLMGCVWTASIVYRGIAISAKGALVFLLIEIATVAVLCATILWLAPARGTPVTLEGFSITAAISDSSGMFRALVFGMLAFCGFDVVSTLAEETRTARRLIPQATILALLLYAGLIIVGMWALTLGGDTSYLKSISEGGRMPINEVAQAVWGRGSIAITFTALSATLALMVATSVGASRILFAKGRRHAAPAAFAELHPRYQVPWKALHVIFAAGIIMGLSVFIFIGAYNAFVWWCTTSTFFAMLTFLFGNVACILLNRHRLRTLSEALLYGLVPALGIVGDLYILVHSFFIELWAQDWATGKSVVVFDVTCAAVALSVVLLKRTEPAAPRPGGVQTIAPP